LLKFVVAGVFVCAAPLRAGLIFQNGFFDPPGTGFFDSSNGAAGQAALAAAENIWSNVLTSSYSGETIKVSAGFSSMGGSSTSAPLAGGSPNSFSSGFSSSNPKFQSNTLYAAALADHLHGSGFTSGAQISITFNSDIGSPGILGGEPFYYGTDGNPGGAFDFESIALHELDHGLGFISSFTNTGATANANPYIYDRFLFRSSNAKFLTSESTDAARLADLTSGDLFFKGTAANAANGGNPVKLYAPGAFSTGSSASHIDQSIFDLMDPVYPAVDHTPSAADLGILSDLGWDTVPEPTCLALVVLGGALLMRRRNVAEIAV
jgi:hypothetical protein